MTLRETYLVDNSLDGRLYPVISDLIDKVDSTGDTSAISAVADQALLAANGANQRLAGDGDFFYGEYAFTGQPNNLAVPAFTNVTSQGINYNAGFFDFSYLGVYAVQMLLTGDCVNSRTDWYQEVDTSMVENGAIATSLGCSTVRLPPTGTWAMRQSGIVLVTVKAGDRWRPVINMITNGTTSNGLLKIRVKKVV